VNVKRILPRNQRWREICHRIGHPSGLVARMISFNAKLMPDNLLKDLMVALAETQDEHRWNLPTINKALVASTACEGVLSWIDCVVKSESMRRTRWGGRVGKRALARGKARTLLGPPIPVYIL